MIWDTRVSDTHLRDPPGFGLPSGESLADLVCRMGDTICLQSGDVEVCFYNMMLPPPLRRYCFLPAACSACLDAGVSEQLGTSGASRPLVSCARTAPMGWAWATLFVQGALQHSLIVPAWPRYFDGVASGVQSKVGSKTSAPATIWT